MIELGSLALIAFVVNIVIEMTKDIPALKKIPTRLYACIVSLIVSLLAMAITNVAFNIQTISSCILSSFIVAYIAIFGYDNIYLVLKKYIRK